MTTTNIPRGGLIVPSSMHRFRVTFYNDTDETDDYRNLAQQVASINFSMFDKRIVLIVRDDVQGWANAYIEKCLRIKGMYRLAIGAEPCVGEEITHAKIFHDVQCTAHSCGFDYSKGDAVHHHLTFSYRRLEIVNGQTTNRETRPFDAPYRSDASMIFETPAAALKRFEQECDRKAERPDVNGRKG